MSITYNHPVSVKENKHKLIPSHEFSEHIVFGNQFFRLLRRREENLLMCLFFTDFLVLLADVLITKYKFLI
jgi:hypothetical protein